MKLKSFVFNPFFENTYVLWDETDEGIVVDPGCYESYEIKELIDFVAQEKISVKAIVNTHCHIDHVLGNEALKQHFQCPLWIPEGEMDLLRSVKVYAPQWGIVNYQEAEVDHLIKEKEVFKFGKTELQSIFVPGHSPGHLMYFHNGQGWLIGGDVLFRESIGRTDLPGGNHEQLINNIRSQVYVLPGETVVYPGHGPETTINHERRSNPFVKAP